MLYTGESYRDSDNTTHTRLILYPTLTRDKSILHFNYDLILYQRIMCNMLPNIFHYYYQTHYYELYYGVSITYTFTI